MPAMHEIDYKIFGDDMQFVEIELDPNEAIVAEAGGMMYMDDGIEMETIFGDGSPAAGRVPGGAHGRRQAPAHRRIPVHDRVSQPQPQQRKLAFGAPYPGKIIPVHLTDIGGELIARRTRSSRPPRACRSASRSSASSASGLFGGEGFIMQRLQGDGWAFVHAGGTIHERVLQPGESSASTPAASSRSSRP